MNIALFISGRLTCYDTDLIPNLESMSRDYTIHLFVSINGERDEYHQEAEKRLAPWLKKIRYESYTIPDDFIPNTNPETLFQIVDGKRVPYTVLSCFYNDWKCYEMIVDYVKETGIQMDTCVKFRPDISFQTKDWSIFQRAAAQPERLFSNFPPAKIYYGGDTSIPCYVSDAFICTSLANLKVYCNTYHFILETNRSTNGTYRINYEVSLTENIFGTPIDDSVKPARDQLLSLFANAQLSIEYFELPYTLNKMRRTRETVQETQWWRQQKIVP
jgi:hypothetical protein